MAIEVETPEGIVEFPDDLPPEKIKEILRLRYSKPAPIDYTAGMSGPEKFMAGVGKSIVDVGRGVGQMLGMVSQEDIDAARAFDAPLMESGAGAAGGIVGNIATALPLMLIPGAQTIPGAIAGGALMGAAQPVGSDDSRLENAAVAGAGGLIGGAAASGLGRVLAPQTDEAVKALIAEGVTPTPGQILGGGFRKVESALESLPFVGEGVRQSKGRAVDEFNTAVLNRTLEPLGKTVSTIGHEGISDTRKIIEDAYTAALSGLKKVDFDPQFEAEINNVRQMVQTLTPDRQRQVNQIIDDRLLAKMTPEKSMSGESFKAVESDIKRLGREYRRSADFDQRQVGDALNAVVDSLKQQAARIDPKAAEAIRKADTAYSRLLRAENAASMKGSVDGVFSPSQFGGAVRALDSSLRKGASARGEAPMQDLAIAGRQVLGETLPNSGTADRLLSNAALLGGGFYIDPLLAGGMAAGRGLYTAPMQRAAKAVLVDRPDLVRSAGKAVESASPYAGLLGVGAMLNE